jgi:hypothetical protein
MTPHDRKDAMNAGRSHLPVYSTIIAALVLLLCLIRLAHWPELASFVVTALFLGMAWLLGKAARRLSFRRLPAPALERRAELRAERMQERVTDVLLPSMREDYRFLFSATVSWSPVTGTWVNEPTVNMATLALDAVLRRACDITAQREPGNVSLVRHELGSELGKMRKDATGRLLVMAESVQLVLPDHDQQRLDKLAAVRKDEAVWEHERKYEQSKREYLGGDVLKDPGSAVVWWLARNDDQVEKTVRDIGLLARLSAAANNADVPETFQRLASAAALGYPSGQPDPGLDGSDATQSADSGATAADRFDAFLHAMDLREDDPKRVLFARQVADLAALHGRKGLADEMMQRFDELDNNGNSPEANDGGTHVGDETGPVDVNEEF